MAEILSATEESVRRAAGVLRAGGVVALPTETVYGLAGLTLLPIAARRIYELKGRPANNPLIAHVLDAAGAARVVAEWPAEANALAEKFWPGPLTLVLPKHASVPLEATGGLETIAVRSPAHPVARSVLAAVGGSSLSAPSANVSGHTSATCAQHVADDFAHVPGLLVLDGGACTLGIESTVLDLSGGAHGATPRAPTILRPGSVTAEQIAAVLGRTVDVARAQAQGASPGTALRHYAPNTPAVLVAHGELARVLARERARCAVLAVSLDALPAELRARHSVIVMPTGSDAYATALYDRLRHADSLGCERIVIEDPASASAIIASPADAWGAIRDRLMRATT